MPFTPYHFGLGALAKAAAPKHFSFQVFAASQVLMDIEPLINLVFGLRPLHGWTHTYWGAFVIALSSVLCWKLWERVRPRLLTTACVKNASLGASCLLGTMSHVWLDSQYHQEMWRLTPSTLRLLEPGQIELLCLVSLGLAALVFALRRFTSRL